VVLKKSGNEKANLFYLMRNENIGNTKLAKVNPNNNVE
jgi:hypothetical protein